jgi:hypothetical protein
MARTIDLEYNLPSFLYYHATGEGIMGLSLSIREGPSWGIESKDRKREGQ